MRAAAAALLAACVLAAPLAYAQSELARNATPLQAGANRGAADSFQGDHAWYFMAQPGHFRADVALGGMTGDSAMPGTPQIGMTFAERDPTEQFTQQNSSAGAVFTGSAQHAVKVYILVEPPNSPLVRSARNYTITVTGQVSFGPGPGANGVEPIAGSYMSKRNDYGATLFQPDGSILTASNATGSWRLFDPAHGIYTITIGKDRFSARLVPGRGLIEPNNDLVIFEPAK